MKIQSVNCHLLTVDLAKNAFRWLGGKAHDALTAYASGGLDATPKGLTRELEGYLKQGFHAAKIRIGRSLDEDIRKMRLARRVLGDRVELMVDAVMGHHPRPWSAKEALRRARTMEELSIAWFEEPCGNRDYESYAFVREHTTVPVAGGESAVGQHEFRSFLDAGALDWVQPDAAHSGGILECQAIAALTRGWQIQSAHTTRPGRKTNENHAVPIPVPSEILVLALTL